MTSIEQLYQEHHQPLRRYLTRLLADPAMAEDVCHETFVKVLLHCDDYDQVTSAAGWLYHIAKNTAYDHLRRRRRVVMTPLTDRYEAIAGAAALESQFADAEPVWAALNHLPDHYRATAAPTCGGVSVALDRRNAGLQRQHNQDTPPSGTSALPAPLRCD